MRVMLDTNVLISALVFRSKQMNEIRDKDDEKVLYSAILADVDILITGDKDFEEIKIGKPEILKPVEYIRKYG